MAATPNTEVFLDSAYVIALAQSTDAADWSGLILRLVDDSSLRTRIATSAAEFARTYFTPDAVAARLDAVYTAVLSDGYTEAARRLDVDWRESAAGVA